MFVTVVVVVVVVVVVLLLLLLQHQSSPCGTFIPLMLTCTTISLSSQSKISLCLGRQIVTAAAVTLIQSPRKQGMPQDPRHPFPPFRHVIMCRVISGEGKGRDFVSTFRSLRT